MYPIKTLLSFYLIVVGAPAIFAQQTVVCPCTPSTLIPNQDRSTAKHETNYTKYIKKKDTINVNYIYAWQAIYSDDLHFPKGIPVFVTGLGFYDASH